ncbi:hypothetical protein HAX54_009363 [Datura stramonium]|uniref:Uncharacterized protein n=1 Tax=Datura stramonium TaxID=4076 RepID=A0ABS8TFK0_DATST|nr:hypothetical protein [Datura stramonium]
MDLPPGEVDNVFAEVNDDIGYAGAIVPLRVNSNSFKIDGSVYTILKAEGQFHHSTDQEPHQHLKNFLKFYTGMDSLTQSMDNNAEDDCSMDNTYNSIAIILERLQSLTKHAIEETKVGA